MRSKKYLLNLTAIGETMQRQEIGFKDPFNDEIGLGRTRSEISDEILPGLHKEPLITIEEEDVLEELGLGRDLLPRDCVEQDINDNT